MTCLEVSQLKGRIKSDADHVIISSGEKKQMIHLAYQKTGYGQRRFFSCPSCSKRVQRLFWDGGKWMCSKCSNVNLYAGIQNQTKGGYDEIAYRMRKFANKNDIQFAFPFNYLDFRFDSRVGKKKFRQCMLVLQSLENMRFHSLFFHVTYKPSVIRSVTSGKHPLMQTVTLADLKDNIYDWKTGERIILTEEESWKLVKG